MMLYLQVHHHLTGDRVAAGRTPLLIGALLIACALLFADPVTLVWVLVTVAMLLLAGRMTTAGIPQEPALTVSEPTPAAAETAQEAADTGDPATVSRSNRSAFLPDSNDISALERMERLVAVGQLSAGIAHEINNPVAYVLSNLGEVRDDLQCLHRFIHRVGEIVEALPHDSPTYRHIAHSYQDEQIGHILALLPERLTDSIEGVERIGHIVRDMKALVRGGGGSKSLCDLNHDLAVVINIARTRIKGSVKFHVHLLTQCPKLWCNPSQIGQVVLNILINAVQAVGDNQGDISLTQTLRENELEITICDDGPGMSPELLQKAFEPFFTTKGDQDGTGMGLPLSRQLIHDHGGRLEVDSETGVGTCFRIYLPIPQQEQQDV
jgi:two-component system, NtrC family, sensor kinase